MFQTEAMDWAEETFGACDLGDARRTKRLVDVGTRRASQIGCSLSKCCEGDEAALLGGYRLLRNEEVKPEAIREGGFAATVQQAQGHALLLAVEDTTSVSYEHAVAAQLGTTSNSPNAKRRGYQVHSVLLHWVLLTTEPVAGAEDTLTVVGYYECRWRIEDYHKAWKSGVGAERQRFQSPENLERMMAITGFLAVRLLQLRESQSLPTAQEATKCDEVLNEDEWKILWVSTEHCPPPPSPPSAHWAYLALARLGGFADTKRTGRAGWDTLWHGWFRLQERVTGYRLSQLDTG